MILYLYAKKRGKKTSCARYSRTLERNTLTNMKDGAIRRTNIIPSRVLITVDVLSQHSL